MVKRVTFMRCFFFFLPPLKIKIILRNSMLEKAVQTLENQFQLLLVDLRKGWPQRLSPACALGALGLRPATLAELARPSSAPAKTPGVAAPEGGPPGILEELVVQPVGPSWGTDFSSGDRPEHLNVKDVVDTR